MAFLIHNGAPCGNKTETGVTILNKDDPGVFSYNGSTIAGTVLFKNYFDRLYSLVFYSVGKDSTIAEEITRDTFLTVLKSLKRFTGKSNIYNWLIGIANHKIADYYRRQKKEHKNISQVCFDKMRGDWQIMDDEFEYALFNLPLHYRQVLLLKYVEEMPIQDISHIMNRSPKSIEGILTRARIALKTTKISSTCSRL